MRQKILRQHDLASYYTYKVSKIIIQKFGFIPQFGKSKIILQTECESQDNNVILRNAELTDLTDLANLFKENAANINCAAARTTEDWHWLLQSARDTMFFDNPTIVLLDDVPIGYFCWDRFEQSIKKPVAKTMFKVHHLL